MFSNIKLVIGIHHTEVKWAFEQPQSTLWLGSASLPELKSYTLTIGINRNSYVLDAILTTKQRVFLAT